MSKILFLEITCCSQCPYLEYDSYYDMSTDSGWDCNHSNGKGRIIDDAELKMLKHHDGPKLPVDTVPDWCPLPDKSVITDNESDTLSRGEPIRARCQKSA